MSLLKDRRLRTFLDFFKLLLKHRSGRIGLMMLTFFVFVAVFAPVISPHKPDEMGLADRFALPIWFKLLPQYSDLPENLELNIHAQDWLIGKSSEYIVASVGDGWLSLSPSVEGMKPREDYILLEHDVEYPYSPPKRFEIHIPYTVTVEGELGSYARIRVYLVDVDGRSYMLYDGRPIAYNKTVIDPPLRIDTRDIGLKLRLGFSPYDDVGEKIFSKKGVYRLRVEVRLFTVSNGTATVRLGTVYFRIPGLVFGLLGTDNLGSDLFANLIYGTRVSLLVGILASVISVSIGLAVGVVAGYKGGFVDQTLMFLTDTLLFMPTIPLLIAISVFIGKNLYLTITLIALLSWMGFARNCRALVMSLRDRPFVEAVKAIGGSDIYIIYRHVIPQLTPIIYITLVLNIPGAILLEAALSFLNLGDPTVPSWGRMLYNARYSGAFFKMMWWWIVPPGLMITFLAMSFILIGQALDEIFNPKLKARR